MLPLMVVDVSDVIMLGKEKLHQFLYVIFSLKIT